jgi:hypothetical protein
VGGDFLGLCDQKSSYKHVSDFGRLQSYDQGPDFDEMSSFFLYAVNVAFNY